MSFKKVTGGLFAGLVLYAALELINPKVSSNSSSNTIKPTTTITGSPIAGSANVSVTNTKGDSISARVFNVYTGPKITNRVVLGNGRASHNYDFVNKTQTVKGKVNVNGANSLEGEVKNYGSPITTNSSNSRAYGKNTFDANSSPSNVAKIVRTASDMKSFYNRFLAPVPTFFSNIFGSGKNYAAPNSVFKKISLSGYDLNIGAKLKNRKLVTSVSFA